MNSENPNIDKTDAQEIEPINVVEENDTRRNMENKESEAETEYAEKKDRQKMENAFLEEYANEELENNEPGLWKKKMHVETYEAKDQQQKEEEINEHKKKYANELGLEENSNEEEYLKKREEIIKMMKECEENEEMLRKQRTFIETLRDAQGIPKNQEGINVINDYLAIEGEACQQRADMGKIEYLCLELKNKESLMKEQHASLTLAIEELERYADLLRKGIDNLDEEEQRQMERYLGSIGGSSMESPRGKRRPKGPSRLNKVIDKTFTKGKRAAGFWGGLAAAIFSYLTDGQRWDNFMERVTKKKVPNLVKTKK